MPQFDPNVDYYEILQVHPVAHQEVVKRAYHTLLGQLQGHPDLGGSHEQAVRINEAYQVLSDPEKRRAYDEARRQQTMNRTEPPPPAAAKTVLCPRCGTRNRLPAHAHLSRAKCGKCHAALSHRSPLASELPRPESHLRLTTTQLELLAAHGEVRIAQAHLPSHGHLFCARCHAGWSGVHLPTHCPYCGSTEWGTFRVFHCRHCRHQFYTTRLHAWPYWLFAACPACRQPHWHSDCEKHLLRWVLNWFVRG